MCAYRWEIYFCPNLTATTTPVQIGIDYTGTGEEGELSGCVNDAMKVREFLISRFCAFRITRSLTHVARSTGSWKFKWGDICVLTDDGGDPRRFPTKARIIRAMRWLVEGAQARDSLFFFCERTGYTPDRSAYIFQMLAMVHRRMIPMVTRLTERMKVGSGGCKECLPLTVCHSHHAT